MTKVSESNNSQKQSEHPTHQMRLPGFITDEEIGLGDVLKRVTSYLGIKICGNCERRAAALNSWVAFTSRSK